MLEAQDLRHGVFVQIGSVVPTHCRPHTVPFESICQSHIMDPYANTKFESCHGSWGQFVKLIFHVMDHSNCLKIVEK